jgi:hypothetical protein
MSNNTNNPSIEREALLQWVGGIGAVTAEALSQRELTTVSSARARLAAAQGDGLLARQRPLTGRPALYTLTRAALRAARLQGLQQCRVSPANALHLITCVAVAAGLERCYPAHRVIGERELRRQERVRGAPLASAHLADGGGCEPRLHRPDLVLWPDAAGHGLPVAVEVELAVKAPRRLAAICRSWARCREVAGALYLAAPSAERALLRAIEEVDASPRVLVVPLDALPEACPHQSGARQSI